MPLMNVDFPANAILLYNLLMNMASFDILPSTPMEIGIFEFEDSTTPDNF